MKKEEHGYLECDINVIKIGKPLALKAFSMW